MNIFDFFNKEIKKNILSKSEYNGNHAIMAQVDWRNADYVYYDFYTDEQLKYLFSHGLLQKYVKTGAAWERPHNEYFEFTDKGKALRKWYNRTSIWRYFYYKFNIFKLKYKWWNLRIKMGHHYDWQDYVGVDINEI